MDSVQTQTFSIRGDGGGDAYIDFCNGQLCVSVVIEGKQADFHFDPVTLKMFAHAYKLLKEKGFNERKYLIDVSTLNHCYKYLSVPPQSVAQKWLREIKNIHICVYNCACGYGYEISKADNGTHITSSVYEGPNDGGEWDTYEEALETGLQEALKLI